MIGWHDPGRDPGGLTIAMPLSPQDEASWQDTPVSRLSQASSSPWMITVFCQSDREDAGRLQRMRQAMMRAQRQAHQNGTTLPDRLPASARAVVRQAHADGVAQADGRDGQLAAMRWLVTYFTSPDNHFTYALDAPDGDGRNNLDVIGDFLNPDGGHRGYCTHYAAALAILGRALGVPTRLTLGYSAGEGEAVNGAFRVTARQLHAWAEAYIDGAGWVPFDVTPAADDEEMEDAADGGTATDDAQTDTGNDDVAQGNDRQSGDNGAADGTDGTDADGRTAVGGDGTSRDTANDTQHSRRGAAQRTGGMTAGVALAIVAAALLAAAGATGASRLPALWRRRRLRAALDAACDCPEDTAARARAWQLAWAELSAPMRRLQRREPSLTDPALAERLIAVLEAGTGVWPDMPDETETAGMDAAVIRTVAQAADIATFGGTPPPVNAALTRRIMALAAALPPACRSHTRRPGATRGVAKVADSCHDTQVAENGRGVQPGG